MEWEDSSGLHPNVAKFLSFLGKAEGADYNTIVGGSSFNDFSKHPGVVGLRTKEGPSTAAGRYQITQTTYNDVAPRLGITDFSQKSQDLIAAELIRRKNALDDVVSGNFESAINKLGGTWASLPSSPYSQPKRDWNFVKANLTANSGWEDAPSAPSAGGGWEDAPTVTGPEAAAPASPPPQAPAQVAKAPVAVPAKKEEPRGVLRRVDDFVRGAADTLTFGYADEIAGKLDSMFGGGQSGLKSYAAAVAAQRQRDKEGGAERIAGQIVGGLAPTVGVIRAVPGASRLARAGAGAATGAIQGGLYGTGAADGTVEERIQGGAIGAGTGAVLGGALGAVLPATIKQKGNALIKSAGGEDAARVDAEIIQDIKKLSESSTKRGNPMTALDVNAIETKYINDVTTALKPLAKSQDLTAVREAVMNRRALTPDDLAGLRTSAAGNAAADAIEKAQRARSMTQAMQSSGGVLPLMREGVDYLPVPAGVNRGLKALLGGRQTREVSIQNALKQADAADNVLNRLGPSSATASMGRLQQVASQAQKARAAQVEAAKRLAEQKAAKEAATKLTVLQDTRMPQTGAFANLLQGGKSGLNLKSDEAIEGLRLVSRQFKDRPVGQAAKTILKSNNVDDSTAAFYGVQNQLRKLQEQGVLSGPSGALSQASSGVRNPISYAEAVRTAGEAANLARTNAPTKELAQFATKVAGTKTPTDKMKLIADRMAKSNDPAEQAFLTQFVEPLAQFGKK